MQLARLNHHERIVAYSNQLFKSNHIVILMMSRSVTRRGEVARLERVAGGVDSKELWKLVMAI
jgi:hypothetical protein